MIELQKQFFRKYVAIYRPLLSRLNRMLFPYHISNSQFIILNLLNFEGELTLNEIAKKQNIEKPTVTQAIQRLVELGYINTKQGLEDRRQKKVSLTSSGTSVCEDINGKLESLYSNLLQDLSKEDVQAAYHLLERLQHALLETEE